MIDDDGTERRSTTREDEAEEGSYREGDKEKAENSHADSELHSRNRVAFRRSNLGGWDERNGMRFRV